MALDSEAGPSNLSYFIQQMEMPSMNLIFNAPYAVDTFFFLSGFLVCYSMLNLLDAIDCGLPCAT